MPLIPSVQLLMDQALMSNEKTIYSNMCTLNLHTDLMDYLKILNIHKNILYTNFLRLEGNVRECNVIVDNIFKVVDKRMNSLSEKNGHEFLKIKKSLESFGYNIDSLIEDIVNNKIKETQKVFEQNQTVFDRTQLAFEQKQLVFEHSQKAFEQKQKAFEQKQKVFEQKQIAFEHSQKAFEEQILNEKQISTKKSIRKQRMVYIVSSVITFFIYTLFYYETTSNKRGPIPH